MDKPKCLACTMVSTPTPPSECEPERRQLDVELLAQVEVAIRVGLKS